MNRFDVEIQKRLESIREQGLYRELRRIDSAQSSHLRFNGSALLNFSSNDYLGLASHPLLKSAATDAIERFGTGCGASRLICGSLEPHHELDETIASFKQTEAALSFSSGYATALGAITALVAKDDVIIMDKLVHASIVDAARLSGAKLRIYAHNNLESLEDILKWAAHRRPTGDATGRTSGAPPVALVVTESVFSMDGDQAPLREITALKEKYGAWLLVDEAHGTGLYGPNRRGVAEEQGVSHRIEIQMGTLGKALGSAGGYVCGSKHLVDLLVNRARSFIFSTAPVPAAAAAATAAIRLVMTDEGEERRRRLWERVEQLPGSVRQANKDKSAIVPILIGDERRAVEVASALRAAGIYIPAVRYPTVARGEARLRLTVSAGHSAADIEKLASVFEKIEIKRQKGPPELARQGDHGE